MTNQPKEQETTKIPVVTGDLCAKIAKKYGWEEADFPEFTGIKDLPWDCIFKGKVEFPKAWNEVGDDQ